MDYLIGTLDSLRTIIAFVVAIGIVVFVHEFGHYFVARLCGLTVREFSIGFGPSLLQFIDRQGTKWKFSLLLLGGYVKIDGVGDINENETLTNKQYHQEFSRNQSSQEIQNPISVKSKFAAVAGGPLANFILAIFLFAGMVTYQGFIKEPLVVKTIKNLPPSINNELLPKDEISAINGVSIQKLEDLYSYGAEASPSEIQFYTVERKGRTTKVEGPIIFPPILDQINIQSPAERMGLNVGDVILSVDGVTIFNGAGLREIVSDSKGNSLDFEIWRNGDIFNLPITPTLQDLPNGDGEFVQRYMIGVSLGLSLELETYIPGPIDALWIGTGQTYGIIIGSIQGLAKIITAEISSCNLQGPIGIAQMTGSAAQQGWGSFIFLIAVLSAAIGFINLLPIPILDGGHLVLYTYTMITGREVNRTIKDFAFKIGLALILSIFIFSLYNDLTC